MAASAVCCLAACMLPAMSAAQGLCSARHQKAVCSRLSPQGEAIRRCLRFPGQRRPGIEAGLAVHVESLTALLERSSQIVQLLQLLLSIHQPLRHQPASMGVWWLHHA